MRKKSLLFIGLALALLLLFLSGKPAPDCHAIPTASQTKGLQDKSGRARI